MPSKACVVEPPSFSLHVFLVQPHVALWRTLFTFPFWLIALAAECIVLDGCQQWSLWSVFPVLYLLAWKELKKHRCFSVEWAGRHCMCRSNLLLGFFPSSVAFKLRTNETVEFETCFTSHKQSLDIGMHRLFQPIESSEVPVCVFAFLICKSEIIILIFSLLRALLSGF